MEPIVSIPRGRYQHLLLGEGDKEELVNYLVFLKNEEEDIRTGIQLVRARLQELDPDLTKEINSNES